MEDESNPENKNSCFRPIFFYEKRPKKKSLITFIYTNELGQFRRLRNAHLIRFVMVITANYIRRLIRKRDHFRAGSGSCWSSKKTGSFPRNQIRFRRLSKHFLAEDEALDLSSRRYLSDCLF